MLSEDSLISGNKQTHEFGDNKVSIYYNSNNKSFIVNTNFVFNKTIGEEGFRKYDDAVNNYNFAVTMIENIDNEKYIPDSKYNIGDKVVYTNEYGVCFGVKEINQVTVISGQVQYTYKDQDAFWFPTKEQCFTHATMKDLLKHKEGDYSYFDNKYGFNATKEQLDSLLYDDPFKFLDNVG